MKFIKVVFKLGVIFACVSIISLVSLYTYAKMLPKIEIRNASSLYLYDKDNTVFFQGNGTSEWISLNKMNKYVVDATISVEDKRFYEHDGFDYIRIFKAVMNNVVTMNKSEGASTITQQYARNLYLTMDKTWNRKIEEAWLSMQIEMHYTKDEILEGYLNTINYNHGAYGIENASRYYFDKSASDLTLAEASMLAGIPKAPSNYSPLVNYEKAKKRQEVILYLMLQNKKITEDEYNKALSEKLEFYGKKDKEELKTIMYYQYAVMKELEGISSIPKKLIETGGLKIYTTLDMNAQKKLEESQDNNKKSENIQVSSVMMDPNTGGVLALTGGYDFSKSEFNRATSSLRQVGSTIKPLLYYAALENGFTPSTTFLSEKTVFTFSQGKEYSPENYELKYPNKDIPMVLALAYSDNIYAVKTHLLIGREKLVDIAKRVGIHKSLTPNPSLALGTDTINIIDMVQAYSAFANEGSKVTQHFITRIEDLNGQVLYKWEDNKEPVLNKSLVYILNEMMTSTYDFNFIDYNTPTLLSLAPKLTRKYAIKTGSTNTDSWTIGYDRDVVLGVWVGYDDNKTLDTTDFGISKNVWADSVEGYLNKKEVDWYVKPANVSGVLINPITGKIATEADKKKKIMYYVKGSEPFSDTDFESVFKEKEEY